MHCGSPLESRAVMSFRPALSAWPVNPALIRQMLATTGLAGFRLGKFLVGWRPLVVFWLSVLAVIAIGGAVLQYLGPPAVRSVTVTRPLQEPAPRPPQQRTIPTEARLSVAALPAPRSAEQAPASGRSAPETPPAGNAPLGGAGQDSLDQATGATRISQIVLFHASGSDNGRDVAQQLAAQAGVTPDQIRIEMVADPPQRAIIRIYSPADHALARRFGRELGQLGYAWQIENRSARVSSSGQQFLEVWLPRRPAATKPSNG